MSRHDPTLRFGAPLYDAQGVVILVHGRGSSAEEIAALAKIFPANQLAFLAPNATDHTWYPQRFLSPLTQNEPWRTSALGVIDNLVAETHTAGIPYERIALVGFSQGACLSLEYLVTHPRRYWFVGGLSGALMGPIQNRRAAVDLQSTPVLLGCAEQDAHIPLEHVEHTANTLNAYHAEVTKHIFPGASHGVFVEEINWLKQKALNHV